MSDIIKTEISPLPAPTSFKYRYFHLSQKENSQFSATIQIPYAPTNGAQL